jgi:two-component sensor histidine kinase
MSAEVKTALAGTAQRLRDFANVHRSLQPPPGDGPVDLSGSLQRLCMSVARARLNERGIDIDFIGQCADVAAGRCWRVGLIVSELITNAIRHAFPDRGGVITVKIKNATGVVECRVSDNCVSRDGAIPGRGSRIVDALAEELGGYVERQFAANGTTVLLSFPEHDFLRGPSRLPLPERGHGCLD